MNDEEYSGWYHAEASPKGEPVEGEIADYSEAYWSRRPEAEEKRLTRGRIIGIIAAVVLLIIVSAYLFAGTGRQKRAQEAGVNPGPEISAPLVMKSDTEELPRAELNGDVKLTLQPQPEGERLTLQEIYRLCQPSVVSIRTGIGKAGGYLGTGVVLTEDGYILTNAHVLDRAESATVTMLEDETEYEAKLVGSDTVSDLAVLKIEAQGLTPAQFASSDTLQVGDPVVAIGNPLGQQLNGTMTDGIVSAINRNVIYGGHSMTLIQTNAAINEGNSGGPLINAWGQVVGITNMKAFNTGVEGIGFAIPTSVVRSVADALLAEGEVAGRPSIGIVIGPVDEAAAEYYSLPAGLYVESVAEKSDAAAKGIQPGDIVTAVNGQSVTTTYEVNAIKEGLKVGDTMTLTIYRDGKTFDVEVTLMDTNDIY